MPSSARKSSVGQGRRDSLKSHLPYRGDEPGVGKKTGINVRPVRRKSDGFERFEEVMTQADTRTPPKVKGRKKKRVEISPIDEEDDIDDADRTQDMDLDSPIKPTNMTNIQSGHSIKRVGASGRPVRPSSDIDYDEVPSPIEERRSRRKSLTNRSSGGAPRKSSLSQYSPINNHSFEHDGTNGFNEFDQEESYADTTQTSLVALDHDDMDIDEPNGIDLIHQMSDGDDDDEEEDDLTIHSAKDKGKGKAIDPPPDEPPDQSDEEPDEDMDMVEEPPEAGPSNNSSRRVRVKEAKKEAAKPNGRPKKNDDYESPPGARRSQRHRYQPLDWWRLEKVIYGKRESGVTLVPQIKEIVRIPKEPPVPLGKRKRSVSRRSKSRAPRDDDDALVSNPEEGWDDDTDQLAVVIDFKKPDREVERRLAFTAKMIHPQPAANADWFFQKVFGDDDFIAAGQILIPPGCRKPSKPARDNTYVFYVIEGAVNFKVHGTNRVLTTGGMFMIPRGNTYFIENISTRDAKLFFTQARKTWKSDEEDKEKEKAEAEGQELTVARSSESRRPESAAPLGERTSSPGPTAPPPKVNGRGASKTRGSRRAASSKT